MDLYSMLPSEQGGEEAGGGGGRHETRIFSVLDFATGK